MTPHVLNRAVLLMCSTLMLVSCLTKTNSDVPFLLEQPYERLTNAELIAYEQEINDALARTSRSGNGDVRVGIGFGSWGGNVGYGVSADRRLSEAGSDRDFEALQTRRDSVRDEMRKRGLLPPQ